MKTSQTAQTHEAYQPRTLPGRPPRLPWVFTASPVYFVTCSTRDRRPLLANDAVHNALKNNAKKAGEVGVAVGRYVIMPDHIHLFARVAADRKLSQFVKHLKEAITKSLNETFPRKNIWQPGFFDHLLRSAESYSEKWAYVRQNPVRAGLVTEPEDWSFQGEIVNIHL